jgi:hypothetical protein
MRFALVRTRLEARGVPKRLLEFVATLRATLV